MYDSNRYDLRLKHCPIGCGHQVTERVASSLPAARCPRCNGATLANFMDIYIAKRETSFYPAGIQV